MISPKPKCTLKAHLLQAKLLRTWHNALRKEVVKISAENVRNNVSKKKKNVLFCCGNTDQLFNLVRFIATFSNSEYKNIPQYVLWKQPKHVEIISSL